jgi:hypothetical protein
VDEIGDQFWMVFNPARKWKHPPRKQYPKLAEAMRDARALSEQFPGQRFYVLQAIGVETVPKPVVVDAPAELEAVAG